MPPANNNFESAQGLAGLAGELVANNIGATAQAGEPANAGKTVWFSWRLPVDAAPPYLGSWSGAIFFRTLHRRSTYGGAALPEPQLRTVLRIYSGSGINSLTEVPYIYNWPRRYANYDPGSIVAFEPVPGTTYYIRVDGDGGAEGNFPLVWGSWSNFYLGSCDSCGPDFNVGQVCVGTVRILDVRGPVKTYYPFGTYPPGRYTVRYCHGAWYNGLTYLVDNQGQKFPDDQPGHPLLENSIYVLFDLRPDGFYYYHNLDGPVIANGQCRSQPGAEFAVGCVSHTFPMETTSSIQLAFQDNPYGPGVGSDVGNFNGHPNPVFALYRRFPVFGAFGANANWIAFNRIRCVFTVKNLTGELWRDITVTLAATGGVTNPTGPVMFDIGTVDPKADVQFDFDAEPFGNEDITATLKFHSDAIVDPIPDVTFSLKPIITCAFQTVAPNAGPLQCAGVPARYLKAKITNTGFLTPRSPVVYAILVGGLTRINDNNCAAITSAVPATPGNITQVAGQSLGNNGASLDVWVRARKVDMLAPYTSGTISLRIVSGSYDYGTFGPFTQTWPLL